MWSFALIFLAFIAVSDAVWGEIQNFQQRCSVKGLSEDLHNCKVYNTNEVRMFDMSSWTKSPPSLTGKREEIFHEIKIESYPVLNSDGLPSSSYNITLVAKEVGITGFRIEVETHCRENYHSYRLIDCRDANFTKPLVLSYPCYRIMDKEGCHHYQIRVFSLPHNVGTTYSATLAHLSRINPQDFCSWESTLVVNMDRQKDGKVEVQFQKANETYGITHYLLQLLEVTSPNKTIEETLVTPREEPRVVFEVKESGEYFIRLVPKYSNDSIHCFETETLVFAMHIEPPNYDHLVAIAAVLGVVGLLVLVCSIIFFLYRCAIVKPEELRERPRILILYSHDSKEHIVAIMMLVSYLEIWGHCKVVIDSRDILNAEPSSWIHNEVMSADFVVFFLSPKAITVILNNTKQDDNNFGFQLPEHDRPWINLLGPAFKIVQTFPHKCIMVKWDTDENSYPGVCHYSVYRIGHDMNKLLARLHRKRWSYPIYSGVCCGITLHLDNCMHPIMPGSNFRDYEEGHALEDAIQEVNFEMITSAC